MILTDISKENCSNSNNSSNLKLILTLFLLLLFMANVSANNDLNKTVPTHKVQAGIWQPSNKAFSQINANSLIKLQLSFAIQVKQTFVHKGDKVKQGQALLAVNSDVIQHDLERFQIARKKQLVIKRQLHYLNKIIKNKLVSRSELFSVETADVQAEKEKADAWLVLVSHLNELGHSAQQLTIEKQLDKEKLIDIAAQLSQLYAPFSGRLMTRLPISGYRYEAGKPIADLENNEKVYISVYISPEKLPLWLNGKRLNGETYLLKNNKKVLLETTRQTPAIDPATGLLTLFFTADNPDNHLHNGEWLEVNHLERKIPVLWVPRSAVVSRDSQSWCLLKQKNGDIIPVAVIVGQEQNNQFPVLKGLKENQQVVTQGAYELLYRDIKSLIQFVD